MTLRSRHPAQHLQSVLLLSPRTVIACRLFHLRSSGLVTVHKTSDPCSQINANTLAFTDKKIRPSFGERRSAPARRRGFCDEIRERSMVEPLT
ncbi:hypothetical protein DL98DRAFT_517514 [Cadophora sp. DSE1049]|nr:hypothetical protein DL98DRAFT_517514 [Cadophora sp. DSE1049]